MHLTMDSRNITVARAQSQRPRTGPRARLLLGVIAAGALLAACTPGDPEGGTTTTTPSPTTSSSSTTSISTTSTTDPGGSTTTTTSGSSTTTSTTVPPSGSTWKLRASDVLVAGDGCESISAPCGPGLSIYLVQVSFRSTFGEAGSSSSSVVEPGTGSASCTGGCHAGSTGVIPTAQGTAAISRVFTADVASLAGGAPLSIGGSVLVAFAGRSGGDRSAALDVANDLATAVTEATSATIEPVQTTGTTPSATIIDGIRSFFTRLDAAVGDLTTRFRAADRLVAIRPIVLVGATDDLASALQGAGLADTSTLQGVAATFAESGQFSVSFDNEATLPIAFDLDLTVAPE